MLVEADWLALCFLVFGILLYKPTRNTILSILDKRIKEIEADLENAQNERIQAENKLNELTQQIIIIQQEQQELISKTKAEIAKDIASREEAFKRMITYKEEAAVKRLQQMQNDAFSDMEKLYRDKVLDIVSDYFYNGTSKADSKIDLAVAENALPKKA